MAYAVIFDHDGTLLNNGLDEGRAVSRAIKPYGIDVSAADFAVRFASITSKEAYALLERDSGITLPARFEAEAEQAIIEEARLKGKSIIMPGMHQSLARLAENSVPLAIASSSGFDWLNSMLTQTALMHYFESQIYSAKQVKHGKPAPDLLLFAANGLQVEPEKTIYIGDGVPDIVAAKAAGMKAIGLIAGDHCQVSPSLRERMLQAGADGIAATTGEMDQLIESFQVSARRPTGPRQERHAKPD